MVTILLGIISSTVAEIITALNKKLQNTVLKGDAAFLVIFGISLIGAVGKEIVTPGFAWMDLTNIPHLTAVFSEIFSVSQIYFIFVVEKLGLDIQPLETVTTTKTAVAATVAVPAPSTVQ